MPRLQLVTLLTIAITGVIIPMTFAAPPILVSDRNVTSSTSTTTTAPVVVVVKPSTESTKIYFANDTSTISSAPVNQVIVETDDDVANSLESENDGEKTFFSIAESNSDSDETQNKIETKVDTGDAPKIISHVITPMSEPLELITQLPDDFQGSLVEGIPHIDDEDYVIDSPSDAPETSDSDVVDVPAESSPSSLASSEDAIVKIPSTTTPSTTTPYITTTTSLKPILKAMNTSSNPPREYPTEVILTSDPFSVNATVEVYDLRYNNGTDMETPRDNADVYPKTFWDQVRDSLVAFTHHHEVICAIALAAMGFVLLLLLLLVIRECCKNRQCCPRSSPQFFGPRRSNLYESVTADLYNTSSCSQYYKKPMVLPNQQDVTMQLLPSDISTGDIC